MKVYLLFTITDTRAFSNETINILSKPSWPYPTEYKEFVKYTGPIVPRKNKGLSSWVGENLVCEINNGIKFPRKILLGSDGLLQLTSKHLYSTEKFVLNKYEFEFTTKNCPKNIDYTFIQALINKIFSTNIRVNIGCDNKDYNVRLFAKNLPEFHIHSSTIKSRVNLIDAKGFIYSCIPQIYIHLEKNEKFISTKSPMSLIVEKQNEFKLLGGRYQNINSPLRVWIHQNIGTRNKKVSNRGLRISILRLHSEYECLKNILGAIRTGKLSVNPLSDNSNNLQKYFKNSIATFLKEKNQVVDISGKEDFIDYFTQLFTKFQVGELKQITNNIKQFNFRPQIENKTTNFISTIEIMEKKETKYEINAGQIGAVGDNAKAEHNTFQQANGSNVNFEKLQEELKELRIELQRSADTSEHFDALANVSKAEAAAKDKDESKVLHYLGLGGKWVFDVATKIGISLVTEMIKHPH